MKTTYLGYRRLIVWECDLSMHYFFHYFFLTVKVKWQFLSFFFVKQAHQFIIVNLVNPIKFWKNTPWTFTNIQRNISAGTLVCCPGIHLLEPHVFVSLQRISKKLKLGSLTKIQHDSSIHETIFVFPWKVLKKNGFFGRNVHITSDECCF